MSTNLDKIKVTLYSDKQSFYFNEENEIHIGTTEEKEALDKVGFTIPSKLVYHHYKDNTNYDSIVKAGSYTIYIEGYTGILIDVSVYSEDLYYAKLSVSHRGEDSEIQGIRCYVDNKEILENKNIIDSSMETSMKNILTKTAQIYFQYNKISPTEDEKTKMLEAAKSLGSNVNLYYIDLSMVVQLKDEEEKMITDTGSDMDLEVRIKGDLANPPSDVAKRTYGIVRYHDGVAEVLDSSYQENMKGIRFNTSKFSTYAIAYLDTPKTADADPIPDEDVKPIPDGDDDKKDESKQDESKKDDEKSDVVPINNSDNDNGNNSNNGDKSTSDNGVKPVTANDNAATIVSSGNNTKSVTNTNAPITGDKKQPVSTGLIVAFALANVIAMFKLKGRLNLFRTVTESRANKSK